MHDYTFSLITPSHRYTRNLDELYESLLAQTYDKWEWVLFLNGNFQKGQVPRHIAADPRVRIYFDYTGNSNIGYLKNLAFSQGTGEILVEIDHDDLITPDALSEMNIAFQDQKVGFVYSDNAILQMDGEFIPYNKEFGWTSSNFEYEGKSLTSMYTFTPSSQALSYVWFAPDHIRAWRKDIYFKLGGHNPNLSVCDDHDLLVRTYLITDFYKIEKVLYIYRKTGVNTTITRNAEIQAKTHEIFNTFAQSLAERDADIKGLLKLDLSGKFSTRPGYTVIGHGGKDLDCDLNDGIPYPDNSAGVINASHVLQRIKDPIFAMKEIHRVLAHGGWVFVEVPSTDGRGAFQDPTHISYWNENSFFYYTQSHYAKFIENDSIRFSQLRLETVQWENNVSVVFAALWAVKDELPRLPGKILI